MEPACKCIACSKTSAETELYDIFDGIFYCTECAEKYKLNIPKKELPAHHDDWDSGGFYP